MPVRSLRLLAAALLAVVALSACGGGGGDEAGDGVASLSGDQAAGSSDGGAGDEDGGGGEPTDPDDALLEFARCMREHGVDLPDPQPGGGGFVSVGPGPGGADPDDEAFRAAEEACGPILEDAIGDMEPPSPEEQAEMRDRLLEFTECMREHGVDLPDPTFGEDGAAVVEIAPGGGAGGAAPDDDPDFAEADEACRHLLGAPGGPGGLSVEGPGAGGGS